MSQIELVATVEKLGQQIYESEFSDLLKIHWIWHHWVLILQSNQQAKEQPPT